VGDGLKLAQQTFQIAGRMLSIQQQPVESRRGRHLGRVGIGQAQPRLAVKKAALEGALMRLPEALSYHTCHTSIPSIYI
jgi:hypothetical protein